MLGDNPDKPPLIAHDGAPGVSSHLESQASFGFLSDRYRVLVLDACGSGVIDPQHPASLRARRQHGVVPSMSRAANCYDNARIEIS